MKLGALIDQMKTSGIVIDHGPVVLSVAREPKILQIAGESQSRFLRILDQEKGKQDFANLQFLRERLGDRINSPTQIVASSDLVCGVFPFIRHYKVSPERFASGDLLQEVAASLVLMHEAGQEFSAAAQESAGPMDLTSAPEPNVGSSATSAWLRTRLTLLRERHVRVAQHCDFTYANLGVTPSGCLVIFDWEQYGRLTYPAFDLTTFLLGHYYFGGVISRGLDSPVALLDLIERDFGTAYLSRFDLTIDDYVLAFPAYLLLFWMLKQRGFSIAINERMQGMWTRLRQSTAWSSTLDMPEN